MRVRTTVSYLVIALAAVITAAVVVVPSVSVEAVYPIENASGKIGLFLKTRIAGCVRGFLAVAENQRLKRELAAMAVVRGDVERLERENDRLRTALGYVQGKRDRWLAARVLSTGGASAGVKPVIRVDRGALAGVRTGAVAVAPDGLVGVVSEVTPNTAEVMPIIDASVKVACEIEIGKSASATGIVSGGSEEMLAIRYLNNASRIPPRARVLTSGRGGVFPRGIEVGTFCGVREDANGLLQEGEVLPGVDFRTLEDVFIRCEK